MAATKTIKPKKKKPVKISEKVFQKSFMKYLRFNGYYCYKQNVISGDFGGKFLSSGIPEGASDLIVLSPEGIVCFVELKGTEGRQRDTQKIFQQIVEKNQGIYLICTAKESLQTNLEMVKLAVKKKCESIASKYAFRLE